MISRRVSGVYLDFLADDTSLLATATSLNDLNNKLTAKLNIICNWVVANKMTFNPEKSQVFIVNPNTNMPPLVLMLKCPAGSIKSVCDATY